MSLIGNRNTLAFELTPVAPSWELRYAPERVAWAGLAIWVGGHNLCRHVIPGSSELRDALYVPLGPIVDWLVRAFPALEFEERAASFPTTRHLHRDVERWGTAPPPGAVDADDWVDAREAWWSRHFLSAGAEGARLPNVALIRDDEQLVLTWAPPRFFGTDPPTMVSEEGEFALPWQDGRAILERLVADVCGWLRDGGAADLYPWARAERPLDTSPVPVPEKLALFTGRAVDALQRAFGANDIDDLLRALELPDRPADPAASPQCQILRDLSPAVTADLGQEVAAVGRRSAREDTGSSARWQAGRSVARDAARPAGSPIEAGYLAAGELRRSLGLDGQPIRDLPRLLDRLGLSYGHSAIGSQHDRMLIAARESGTPAAVTLHTPRTALPWGQRRPEGGRNRF